MVTENFNQEWPVTLKDFNRSLIFNIIVQNGKAAHGNSSFQISWKLSISKANEE